MKTTKFDKRIKLGVVDNENIYLSPPKWDCGWYWGFGYLGNANCHYHIDGLTKISKYNFEKQTLQYEFVDLHEGLIRHFGDSFIIKKDKDIWTLAELFKTFYYLRETAEVLGRGGAHYTTNPLSDIIKNPNEVKRINEEILPLLFDKIYEILTSDQTK